jgi:uncharacterized membrane protein HdeD (DUF308 family)
MTNAAQLHTDAMSAHLGRNWWAVGLRGVAAIAFGLVALVAAIRLRGDHGRWWMGFGGLLSVVAGLLLALSPPISVLALIRWVGACAVVFGVSLLLVAYRLRSHSSADRHDAIPHPA